MSTTTTVRRDGHGLNDLLTQYAALRSRDGRRERRYPDGYSPASFPPAGEAFRFDGSSRVCPLCSVFLVRGRSRAVRLPRPIPVRVSRVDPSTYVSSVTHRPFYADGRCPPSPGRPRWFAHARCWEAELQRTAAGAVR